MNPETQETKERHKARLVEKGFQKNKIVDFNETFDDFSKVSSIRQILAHALNRNLVVNKVDVNRVSLNGKLDEDILIRQPKGFVYHCHTDYVCKLYWELLCLKKSAQGFYETLSDALRRCRLYPFIKDPAEFFGKSNGSGTWVVSYV